MERVRQWVLTNHTVSESVLSTVQTLGTFVPGRWGEREVLFETVNASLVVVALVEDLIVHEHLQRVDVASLDPPMRATWHSIPTPGLERMLCWALSLLRAVETPLEMACAKHAPRRRWAAVWIVEWVKALLKVLLLLKRRGRMLVKQGHPLRALVNQLPVNKATAGGENQEAGVRHERDFDDDLFPATAQSVAGEALHIARPLVHLALLSKDGPRSWRPWVVALCTDLLSRTLSGPGHTVPQRAERTRRAVALLWYLLRQPMWSALQQRLGWLRVLKSVPVLGFGAELTQGMLDSLTRFYFFTSAT